MPSLPCLSLFDYDLEPLDIFVVCKAPLVASVPLPFNHSPRFSHFQSLPDVEQDSFFAQYSCRKRKADSQDESDEELTQPPPNRRRRLARNYSTERSK